ncbi:hypothetical protein IBE48_09480 [Francisella philomiragia]|uniref:Phosphomannomutase domain protein n=1 Tax=Francisella philomiragia TaxID=28110 RepID=A0AAW3D9G9_9GAMM|nr:hypothetical protein [Francisella philomiragia]KFJ42314.1 phosphomannomutase domain protein [Francisella philomiragia]MBK2255668.1 hypothetical protein [Francisella philomiragia]MBK2273993.1 hypothetical protein [Francisella philomiragia]MBK2277834.1 hypothetical protein [Francisella philomiragia]MBK2281780.1 hypothetical protein [Francisella philomiragia]
MTKQWAVIGGGVAGITLTNQDIVHLRPLGNAQSAIQRLLLKNQLRSLISVVLI